jgi:hypothetical protein
MRLDSWQEHSHVADMKHDPFDFSGGSARASDHGARPVPRLRPGEYSAQFLNDLKTAGTLFEASPQWDRTRAALPSWAEWVLHANGELERIRIS